MAAYFDNLFLAQFGSIYFPIETLVIEGQQRHHMHEFPHTPGGKLEKLGRKAYTVQVTPIFDETIFTYDKANGMPLYPDALTYLQLMYEREETSKFVIPTMGTMNAFITTFRRSLVPGLRSGERVALTFVEDMNEQFALTEIIQYANANIAEKLQLVLDLAAIKEANAFEGPAVGESADLADIKRRQLESAAADSRSLFDKIEGAVNDLFTLQDQGELYLARVEAKVAKATSYLSEADRRLTRLQNPQNWPLVEAVKDLWAASIQLGRTASQADRKPTLFRTPTRMTIQEASIAIFGTTERSFELLQMNAIEDASAIPAGTDLRYAAPTNTRSLAR